MDIETFNTKKKELLKAVGEIAPDKFGHKISIEIRSPYSFRKAVDFERSKVHVVQMSVHGRNIGRHISMKEACANPKKLIDKIQFVRTDMNYYFDREIKKKSEMEKRRNIIKDELEKAGFSEFEISRNTATVDLDDSTVEFKFEVVGGVARLASYKTSLKQPARLVDLRHKF